MNIFEGLHIKLDLKRYPNSVFFFKGDRICMEYHWRIGYFACREEGFWNVLETENRWNHGEVQAFINEQVKKHFKVKSIMVWCTVAEGPMMIEKHFYEHF